MDYNSIDIFCHCIDNFGDAGVAYRFAREFKTARPECRVRVFIDDLGVLREIAAEIDTSKIIQKHDDITFINTKSLNQTLVDTLGVADVMVEIFACHIPGALMEPAYNNSKLIINLEYLSAEDWVEGYHLKESLLGRGVVRKFFFMPGFREGTGGLIINSRLEKLRKSGDFNSFRIINDILNPLGIYIKEEDDELIGTVFTYERGFDTLLTDLADLGRKSTLLVFGDKSKRGMSASLERLGVDPRRSQSQQTPQYQYKNIRLIYMPFISQHDYDTLLCCAGFNIVRGEDSLARAVLAGRPFIWNAYIQDEKYQLVKVQAFLDTIRPYYGDNADLFDVYSRLTLAFNSASAESPEQATFERYDLFLKKMKKYAHFTESIYYFIIGDCDLIAKFCHFLDNY